VKKNFVSSLVMLAMTLAVSAMLTGCQTQSNQAFAAVNAQAQASTNSEPISLREGDVLKISFPGSPTLNTSQQIRRDGKISMPLVGEVDAAGMTPVALERKLVDLYAPQLVTKEVTVEVVSSTFPVYVSGMVLRPGKILSDHPLTVLEAIMEAGGFDYTRANLKDVTVIRREGNIMKHYIVNLKAILDGQESEPFFLKPSDIIYVPERFSMF
jgi:polysaccharide export outer membrane protein